MTGQDTLDKLTKKFEELEAAINGDSLLAKCDKAIGVALSKIENDPSLDISWNLDALTRLRDQLTK